MICRWLTLALLLTSVKAIERWRATVKWRSEMGVGDMLSTPYPYFDIVEARNLIVLTFEWWT